jgi:hypothetical protein
MKTEKDWNPAIMQRMTTSETILNATSTDFLGREFFIRNTVVGP